MKKRISIVYLFVFIALSLAAQPKKYPSLLWEISGNGLSKPSYLFGTMHVSSKLAFHLSDSFYYAIKNVDEVALEQNPLYWQRDMMRINDEEKKIGNYMRNGATNYINEKSFQLEKYEDDIKAALTDEPQVVNGLLYRNFQAQADYEENTYLDLYIYQTGRKLGKKAAGVEDYYQTEKIVFEAYQDALKDQNKKVRGANDENAYSIEQKIQEAYRQGDLDALDSLEKFEYSSPAFVEKFLYKRNEIQAHSIDTIVKHNSLFVGVGAAHLPGKRGVIELLRKMGYRLRPVQMQDRNADRKDEIDKLKVPVVFRSVQTDDGSITAMLPGNLYKRSETVGNESWQYADMENGTYYTINRINTGAALLGQTVKDEERKTDSLLYENIPGKILKKTVTYKNGFAWFDITNRTRRGDMQRYNIIITPFEEIICKMSGNENYVSGAEADSFFNSIQIKYHPQEPVPFQSKTAGFRVNFPQQPYLFDNHTNPDNITRWEWEAVDTANGNAYAVWKKAVNNYRFLEEDTFDLSLMEESLKRSDLVEKETSRSFEKQNGYAALRMNFALKNGSQLTAKAVLRGIHYYLVMAISKTKNEAAEAFINSFSLADISYAKPSLYSDTALHFTVQTPVAPTLDTFLMSMAKATMDNRYWQSRMHSSYINTNRTAFFQNDTTGEAVLVNTRAYPKYFSSKDSASYWDDVLYDKQFDGFIVKSKEKYQIDDFCKGFKTILFDTNTVRQITSLVLLKKNRLYRITALSDTVGKQSEFLQTFFQTFRPDDDIRGASVFIDKQSQFFDDFRSKDSATHALAADAVVDIPFNCKSVPELEKTILSLKYRDKNYFENKSKFIHELGYLHDSSCRRQTEDLLSSLYKSTTDTAFFQNEILMALARLKTKQSYDTLASLLTQDPPVFEDQDDYDDLFQLMQDSLALTRQLFPKLLQLSSIEMYKAPVYNMLVSLIDSSLIEAKDYEPYFSQMYFDAKLELKKMQNNDERLLQKNNDDDAQSDNSSLSYRYGNVSAKPNWDDLTTYSTLLMPFYQTKSSVPLFFQKLLSSQDPSVRLQAAISMMKNHQPVADSIWNSLAGDDKYRVQLLKQLKKNKREDLFPKKWNNQEALAKSILLNDKGEDKFQDIKSAGKQLISTGRKSGYVYFFLYKINKTDDWKLGLSGLQPQNSKEVSTDDTFTRMTERSVNESEPVAKQFEQQLKQLQFATHESAYSFFLNNQYNYYHQNMYPGN